MCGLLYEMVFLLHAVSDVVEYAQQHQILRNAAQIVAVSCVDRFAVVEGYVGGKYASLVPAEAPAVVAPFGDESRDAGVGAAGYGSAVFDGAQPAEGKWDCP